MNIFRDKKLFSRYFFLTLSVVLLSSFLFSNTVEAALSDHFVITVKTNNSGSSNNQSFTIPTTGAGYNYDVDWDNDGTFDEMGITGNVTHDFGEATTTTFRIQGDFPRIYFNNTGDKAKILDIKQWGTIAWTSMGSAFRGASNLDISATDTPNLSGVTDMSYMFYRATSLSQGLSGWDVSTITDMSRLFDGTSSFNEDISGWNVGNVTNMSGMFFYNTAFNQNISGWNVSKVTDMSNMFASNRDFNQDISSWDVSSVTNMSEMFRNNSVFNSDISGWRGGSVTNMQSMFLNSIFNQNISGWDVSSVTNMSGMFYGSDFNQDISGWNVGSVTNMSYMFYNTPFNQSISSWNVGNVTNMSGMFYGSDFNQNISGWNVGSVTNMEDMFESSDFNQSISSWNVGNVTNMSGMFSYTSFNQDISGWNVSKVTDMSYMFLNTSFNQDISGWDVSNVTNMTQMFRYSSFNQDISAWDVSSVTTMSSMFSGNSSVFNQDISGWDVGNVTSIYGMFDDNKFFNQDISGWDVSKVIDMRNVFEDATAFDQDISGWNVSSVTYMNNMFKNTTLSTKNYDALLTGWSAKTLKNNVTFHGGNSTYCLGSSARANIISNYSWNFTDGGEDCSNIATIELSVSSGASTDESVADNLPVLLVSGALSSSATIDVRDLGTGTAIEGVGNDYTYSTPQTITIPAGTYDGLVGTAISLTGLTIVDDDIIEVNKDIDFDLSNPSSALSIGDASGDSTTISSFTYTITNDDYPSVTLNTDTATSTEADGTHTITVTLSETYTEDVTIPFSLTGTAEDPSDYTITPSPLTITGGNTTSDIDILISGDTDIEDNETIIITLGTPTNATLGATTVYTHNIVNDDSTITFDNASQSVSESVGAISLTITQTGITATETSIPYTITGTATLSSDYTEVSSSPLTIAAGESTATIDLLILDDTDVEDSETIIITLDAPTNTTLGATTVHTITIVSEDVVTNATTYGYRAPSITKKVATVIPKVIPQAIKNIFIPEKQFESDPVIIPIYDEDEGESDTKEEQDEKEEKKDSPSSVVLSSETPSEDGPSINIFERVGLSVRDGLDTTKYVVSGLSHKATSFLKAFGKSSAQLVKGNLRHSKETFRNNVKKPEYDPYDDHRIPPSLKDHRYEEVQVKIVAADGQALKGATVTLFSEPKESVTDTNGEATFKDVPIGEHTLKIAYGTYRGEQPLFLKEDVPKILVAVTPNLQNGVNVWVYLLSLILSIVFGGLIVYWIGKRRLFKI